MGEFMGGDLLNAEWAKKANDANVFQ